MINGNTLGNQSRRYPREGRINATPWAHLIPSMEKFIEPPQGGTRVMLQPASDERTNSKPKPAPVSFLASSPGRRNGKILPKKNKFYRKFGSHRFLSNKKYPTEAT